MFRFWKQCSGRNGVAAVASADHIGIHVECSCVCCNESVGGRTLPAAAAVTHLAPGSFAGDTQLVV